MRYSIGIFGCTDQTEAALCTETGQVLRLIQGKTPPEKCIEALLYGISKAEVAICAALSSPLPQIEVPEGNTGKGNCVHFSEALLRTHFCPKDAGAVLYTRTVSALAIQKDEKIYTVKPAPLCGRYAMADAVIRTAYSGQNTALVHLLETAMGMPLMAGKEYLSSLEREERCKFIRILQTGAKSGDAVSRSLAREGVTGILEALSQGTRMLEGCVPLYIHDIKKEQQGIIKAAIASRFPEQYEVRFTDVPPVLGAVQSGADMLGICPDAKFRKNFAETYPVILQTVKCAK